MTASGKKPRNPSLILRLAWRLWATSAAAIAILLVVLYVQFSAAVDSLRDRSLTGQAEDVARHIHKGPDGRLSLELPPELARAYAVAGGPYLFQVFDDSGTLLFSSAGGGAPLDEVEADASQSRQFFLLSGPGREGIHVGQVRIAGPDGPLLVRVGQGGVHQDVYFDEFVEYVTAELAWLVVPLVLLLLLANFVTLRGSLRTIERVSRAAASIGPQRPGQRLATDGVPREILPLVAAANSALDRLEEGFLTQQEFTADAAHELRTPLAVLKTNLEILDDPAVSALREDVAAMGRIVDQLLRAAQLDSFAVGADERADLHRVAVDVAAYLAPLALKQGKMLAVTGAEEQVWVRGNGDAIYHALRNLVENALAYSPLGGTVEIVVDDAGRLRVQDQGPGVPEAQRKLIFRRFWRGARSHRGTGAGLGLAIVARTAQAHGGSVTVEDAPGGGACFTLNLPLAQSDTATPVRGERAAAIF